MSRFFNHNGNQKQICRGFLNLNGCAIYIFYAEYKRVETKSVVFRYKKTIFTSCLHEKTDVYDDEENRICSADIACD